MYGCNLYLLGLHEMECLANRGRPCTTQSRPLFVLPSLKATRGPPPVAEGLARLIPQLPEDIFSLTFCTVDSERMVLSSKPAFCCGWNCSDAISGAGSPEAMATICSA